MAGTKMGGLKADSPHDSDFERYVDMTAKRIVFAAQAIAIMLVCFWAIIGIFGRIFPSEFGGDFQSIMIKIVFALIVALECLSLLAATVCKSWSKWHGIALASNVNSFTFCASIAIAAWIFQH